MQKILVIGCCGAGKSTLATKLATTLSLPLHHLDAYYWHEGWVSTPNDEWQAIINDLITQDKWIIDGNFSSTLAKRMEMCDTVIYLNLPTWLCLYRVLKRVRRYHGKTRPDMGADCGEKLDIEFLKYVLQFKRKNEAIITNLLVTYADKTIIELKSRRQVKQFLNQIKR